MRPGEIYLARFPFGDIPGMKLRPVLLLTVSIGSIPEVLVAYISSLAARAAKDRVAAVRHVGAGATTD